MLASKPREFDGCWRSSDGRSQVKTCKAFMCALLLVCVFSVGLFQASAFAGTGYVDGVSDESLPSWSTGFSSFFANTWVAHGHIKYARYILPWNAMTNGDEGWVDAAFSEATRMKLGLDPSLTVYENNPTPKSTGEYLRELERFLSRAKEMGNPVTYVEPWNEPNGQGKISAESDARYAVVANSACETYKCTIIAGNFDDGSGMSAYEGEMISDLKNDTRWTPTLWGMHPYKAVEQRSYGSVEEFVKLLTERGESKRIVFTEVGSYHCTAAEQEHSEEEEMKDASFLVDDLIPRFSPEHVFYYEFDYKENLTPPCQKGKYADTALFVPSGESEQIFKPREGASLIYRNNRAPWAFTTEANGVTQISANLSGVAYPVGVLAGVETPTTGDYFQYGLTTAYEHATAMEAVPTTSEWSHAAHHASASIASLAPDTLYHYRLVASDAQEASYGEDHTFITLADTASQPGLIDSAGHRYVYYVGENHQIYENYWSGLSWANYHDVEGEPALTGTSPTALIDGAGHRYVYYVGENHQIYENYWSGLSWANYHDVEGEPVAAGTSPTAVINGAGDRWIYYVGENHQIWENSWNGSQWTNHEDVKGEPVLAGTSPTSLIDGAGHHYVYYVGENHQVYENYWNGSSWANYHDVEGEPALTSTSPTALIDGAGHRYVYYVGENHQVYENYWSGSSWGNYHDIEGDPELAGASPTAVMNGAGDRWVYYVGENHQIWENSWNGSQWTNHEDVNGEPAGNVGSPIALIDETGRHYVYYVGADSQIWENYWNGTSWANYHDIEGEPAG